MTWVSYSVAALNCQDSKLGGRDGAENFSGIHLLCWDVFKSDYNGHDGCHTEMSSMMRYEHEAPILTLGHFSDDHHRVFFKCGEDELDRKLLFRRLHEKQLVGASVFSIQVSEVVNDTGLPDLQIDDEKNEVSFDWKGMLDRLMGEEHVFNTILSQRLGWRLKNAGANLPDLQDLQEAHRKLARRSRLQRECRVKFRSNILVCTFCFNFSLMWTTQLLDYSQDMLLEQTGFGNPFGLSHCLDFYLGERILTRESLQDHYTHNEMPCLEYNRRLRYAAKASTTTNHDNENSAVDTEQDFLDELPDDAIIYSGNSSPGPKPGSIPRGIFTDRDYCWPMNDSRALPPPSAADLFSPRPLPELSWGRRRMDPPQRSKRTLGPSHGKRAREADPGISSVKRGKFAAD